MIILIDFKYIINFNENDNISLLYDKVKNIYNGADISLYKYSTRLDINKKVSEYNISNYSNITSIISLNGGSANKIFPDISILLLVSISSGVFVVFNILILLFSVVLIINKSLRNVTSLCPNNAVNLHDLETDGFSKPLNILSNKNIRFNCIEDGLFQLMSALDITKSPLLLLYGPSVIYCISIWAASLSILIKRQLGTGPNCESVSTIMILIGMYIIAIFFILFMSIIPVPFIQEYNICLISIFFIVISIIICYMLKSIINNYRNTEYEKINPYNDLLSVPFFTTLTFIILYGFFWCTRFNKQFMLLFILSIAIFISYLIPMGFTYISNTSTFAISPCWKE